MTTYFVLLIMFQGSSGWVETPARYPDLKWCQAAGIHNSTVLRGSGSVKWRCEKREEKR